MEDRDGTPLQPQPSENASTKEVLSYKGPDGVETKVPVYRAAMPEIYIALQPPDAQPYIMASNSAEGQAIVEFFAKRVTQVEELRDDMRKRFAKTSSEKCRYMTGDVAYVMGRPFQLRVYPLSARKMKGSARGRATSKYSANTEISLLTLYVVHPRNYDEAKLAFRSFAESIILHNATNMAKRFTEILSPGAKPPVVRVRDMRGRWTSSDAGALWLSADILPYPPDCLVYAIWRELEQKATIPEAEVQARFESVLPGWRAAQKMLAERVKPFSNQ